MPMEESAEVTQLLAAWGSGGEQTVPERLYTMIYNELHRLAHGRMRHERAGHTLQTTALIHEAYLRLAGQRHRPWESRGQFFAIAARMMRRALVDYARKRRGQKRGGDAVRLDLDDLPEIAVRPAQEVLFVHEALSALAKVDPRRARLVELRFFGGLAIEEAARCLGVSPGTAMRDWTLAKAWLKRHLRSSAVPLPP